MRNYKRVVGSKKKRYGFYTKQSLANAVKAVNDCVTLRDAAKTYNIPKSTLRGCPCKNHAGGDKPQQSELAHILQKNWG